jgi:hypothetical protein
MNLSYEIQAPLHEWNFDLNRFQRQGLHLSPSIKNLILVATGNFFVHICENGGPIVTHSENFMRGGFLVVMSPIVSFVEFSNGMFHVIF